MKLRRKLVLLLVSLLCGVFVICGLFLDNYFKNYTVSLLAESQGENLSIAGHAFRQVGTREDFEQMGEIARDAYLKYQFEKCYRDGYALIKQGQSIKNLTDYEIVDLGAMGGSSMVQEVEGREILLVRQPLEYPAGFEVLSVKDITPQWNKMEGQLRLYACIFAGTSLAAVALLMILSSRLLRSLEELRCAAADISQGMLGKKVKIHSGDEIGQVGKAFNRMSETVEKQVDDLQLLLGAVAHEMKTPVTSIMGYSDSLLHVRLSREQQKRALEHIYAAGFRMEKMSAKLLSLVGMYENEAIDMEQVSLRNVLEQVKEEADEMLLKKEVGLTLTCPSDLTVRGDRLLLECLFFNLVQNSCKASAPGGRIEVRAEGRTVTVKDYGCGIPPKDLPNVTKAFYMADKSRSRSQGSSGLGLALCQRIMELHRGEMNISSQEGTGTEVSVSFPDKTA